MNVAKVLLGGGRPAFFPKEFYEQNYVSKKINLLLESSESYNYEDDDWDCRRKDGANLIEEWLKKKGKYSKFVDNAHDLNEINVEDTEYLFGLFSESHLAWKDKRVPNQDPSLANMTQKGQSINYVDVKNQKKIVRKVLFIWIRLYIPGLRGLYLWWHGTCEIQ